MYGYTPLNVWPATVEIYASGTETRAFYVYDSLGGVTRHRESAFNRKARAATEAIAALEAAMRRPRAARHGLGGVEVELRAGARPERPAPRRPAPARRFQPASRGRT